VADGRRRAYLRRFPDPINRRPFVNGTTARLAAHATRALSLTLVLAGAAPTSRASAQSAEKDVVGVIETFFAGMLARDTAMMRTTFDPAARLLGIATPRGEQPTVTATSMDSFLAGVARMQGEGANERIYQPEVRIDGDLAQVWTFYTLHVGERFIHCGIDAFQLLRVGETWKIVSVADTRRTERCEVPNG
jgi:hypothetical protein